MELTDLTVTFTTEPLDPSYTVETNFDVNLLIGVASRSADLTQAGLTLHHALSTSCCLASYTEANDGWVVCFKCRGRPKASVKLPLEPDQVYSLSQGDITLGSGLRRSCELLARMAGMDVIAAGLAVAYLEGAMNGFMEEHPLTEDMVRLKQTRSLLWGPT